jgi:hypothetical protein
MTRQGRSSARAPVRSWKGSALAVGVRGHVGPVDGDVLAHPRMLRVQRRRHPVKAAREHVAVGPELGREAIAGVDGWHRGTASDGGAQGRVLGDQRHDARPRRNGVEAFRERHPDQRADRVAGTPGPARRAGVARGGLDLHYIDLAGPEICHGDSRPPDRKPRRLSFRPVNQSVCASQLLDPSAIPAQARRYRFTRGRRRLG